MMKLLLAVSLALTTSGANAALRSLSRRLSYEKIGSYEPLSKVTDHAAIDLDQKAMQDQLGLATDDSFALAKQIYENGAHSKSFAEVVITGALPSAVPAGAGIVGKTSNDKEVRGKALDAAESGASVLKIQYATSDVQATYVDCQVGALGKDGNTNGCFASNGTISIDGFSDALSYAYNVHEDNNNARTLAKFSTEAKAKMYDCPNCPYPDYKKFYDYYGEYDYANKWVLAAFAKGATSFTNGNANFASYDFTGRSEAIKKGTAYMNVWMYVIRELEDALDDCKAGCIDCNDDPVHAWDEAVAFYTGSQQEEGGSTDGYLLYTLANKRCQNFNTCGENGGSTEGLAKLNIDIFRQFQLGQKNLVNGKCDEARNQKELIAQLMAVPLVQGTLRYAFLTDTNNSPTFNEKANAEGAVFAAAVLPVVYECSASDAETIYQNMYVGSPSANFADVKNAFERNYACMGISGSDVGGLYDSATGDYFVGAAPSSTSSSSGSGLSGGAIAGICIAVGVVVIGAAFIIFRKKNSGTIEKDFSSSGHTAGSAASNGHGSTPEQSHVA